MIFCLHVGGGGGGGCITSTLRYSILQQAVVSILKMVMRRMECTDSLLMVLARKPSRRFVNSPEGLEEAGRSW